MVEVATPHAPATFQAVIDTGGPITVVAFLLGQSGFLDAFTVTFGPDGFALEPAATFGARFPLAEPR